MECPPTPTARHQQQKQKLCVKSTTASATTINDLHSDILTDILLQLDGPALASVACADSGLRKLASDRALWERLCFSSFPSLALRPEILDAGTTSPPWFFSRAFPFPAYQDASSSLPPLPSLPPPPTSLVSAVDVYHRGELLYSTLVDTDTQSSWILSAPFCIDALNRTGVGKNNQSHTTCTQSNQNSNPISPEDLSLSWLLIDPSAGDAINLSSHQPVAIERRCFTGETSQARFATVLAGGAAVATITVTLGGIGLPGDSGVTNILEVSLSVADGEEGVGMTGKESLDLLRCAIGGSRVVGGGLEEGRRQALQRYRDHERRKRERKERKAAREGRVDICCTVLWASLLLSSIAVVFG